MYRLLAQLVVASTQVLARGMMSAWGKAAQNAAKQGSGIMNEATGKGRTMTVEEAKKILNIEKLSPDVMETIGKNYEHLYNANDPKLGGSFYLQSKVAVAKQALEDALRNGKIDPN
eukprot:TRINITY_DN51584_c0_g3_i1.p1 TRINITY_DN51584_c0_g3~~TRINITY_DN51584_c0_g3_i1.p1  ORF type:complete len:116 (+),score=13.94 TRINITY_DN51584_c0_g3_i1:44-391(+)